MKRSQSAAEFMILVGFTVLALTVLLAVFQNIIVETQNQRDINRANSFINVVTTEINLAKDSAGNYTRTFYLPTNIRGESYSLVINEQLDLVLNHNDRQHIYFFNESVFGTPGFGTNTIRRSCIGNVCWISLNTQEIPEEIESQLCGEEMNGQGTPLIPFQICSLDHLNMMRNDLDAHYVLTDDIDAIETGSWNVGSGWIPIGTFNDPFTGSLDGQGHTISRLFIDRPVENNIGLFSFIENAEIKNLIIYNADITGDIQVGSLSAQITNTLIENVGVEDSVVSGYNDVGGIIGRAQANSQIITSYFQERATGASTSEYEIGGLVGILDNSNIENSYTYARLEGREPGGIASYTVGSSSIINSYTASRISGLEGDGGAFIYNRGLQTIIQDSYWSEDTSTVTNAVVIGSSNGITHLTMNQMRQESSYSNWNFERPWNIQEGISYPYLIENEPNTIPS